MKKLYSNQKCAVIGGDLRQIHLANLLAGQMSVYTLGLKAPISEQDGLSSEIKKINQIEDLPKDLNYLILPMPAANGPDINAPLSNQPIHIKNLLEQISPDTLVLAGKISAELQQTLTEKQLRSIDYLKREELAVLNAAATAEGTLELLLSELPVTILGLKVLIVGGGRISRALRTRLKLLGADVRVSARKYADLAWISSDGCTAIPIQQMEESVQQVDAIINTVPAPILGHDILQKIPRQTLVIDLASKPGGVDFEEANRLGLKTIWALSLPGKTAPISSGEILFRTIEHIIEEEKTYGKA